MNDYVPDPSSIVKENAPARLNEVIKEAPASSKEINNQNMTPFNIFMIEY